MSVIVPVAPGECEAHGLLEQLKALTPGSEVVIVHVDPEPVRAPPDWPSVVQLRQYRSRSGRARQMNVGAHDARAEWLWFLHADSRLLPDTLPALRRFLARGEQALGWFDLAFRPGGPRLMPLTAAGANLRARWFDLPFGDQGFILPAAWFERLGRFDEAAPYGEDHLLAWKARSAGLRVRRIGAPLATSARKYATHGWLKTTYQHAWLTLRQAVPAWRQYLKARS